MFSGCTHSFENGPDRAPQDMIMREAALVSENPAIRQLLDGIPGVVLVLNGSLQIIYANRAFLDFIGAEDARGPLGKRPGEAMTCSNAMRSENGCGTTANCAKCGAGKAIFESRKNRQCSMEYRVTRFFCGGPERTYDFRAWAAPLHLEGRMFTFLVLLDIAGEKRRKFLEQLFFHDILNTATALNGLLRLAHGGMVADMGEAMDRITLLSKRIVEEIESQKLFLAAEDGAITLLPERIDSLALVRDVCEGCRHPRILGNRRLGISGNAESIMLESDRTLLGRVLTNMVKNALEAALPGCAVTVDCRKDAGGVVFSVHNGTCMPEDVQSRIFRRSFSTKGPGRGLGTYGIKLLTERYLGGRVWFESTPEAGTTFYVLLPLAE